MPPLRIVIATSGRDLAAAGLAAGIADRSDFQLLGPGPIEADQVLPALTSGALQATEAVVELTDHSDLVRIERWLAARPNLIVVSKRASGDAFQLHLRGIGIQALLSCLACVRAICRSDTQLRALEPPAAAEPARPRERPLLSAAARWLSEVLGQAMEATEGQTGDAAGLTLSAAPLRAQLVAADHQSRASAAVAPDDALFRELAAADAVTEPLAAAERRLGLTQLEFKALLLALAPDLNVLYQRCFGVLQDDLGRRAPSLAQIAALLGHPVDTGRQLLAAGNFARWQIVEGDHGSARPDDPAHVDRRLAHWLLGAEGALEGDELLQRIAHRAAWPGYELLRRPQDRSEALALVAELGAASGRRWLVLTGDTPSNWRALLELGASEHGDALFRVDAAQLGALESARLEQAATRTARLARLLQHLVVIDASAVEVGTPAEAALRRFATCLQALGVSGALVALDAAQALAAVRGAPARLLEQRPPDQAARESLFRAAAHDVSARLADDDARSAARVYPLDVAALARARDIAAARAGERNDADVGELFIGACRQVASEGVSRLAHRIRPVFELSDVVLPPDRRAQLCEIVANVRLADRVLHDWRFGEKLPYGRGVAALFQGPSGTGKSMAAQAIARTLGIEIYALDLSRVVSKFIGETEKNIDLVLADAARSGAAVLVDEAEGLLGKRSKVEQAHDRYANIEVAYLLQRMESFDGLVLFTTNLAQNIDPAFLRRLRFIIDFPRPDAQARSDIWRACLPVGAHALAPEQFRALGRYLDLTGGHIRQIALRAAFLAADSGSLIGMPHLISAGRAELAKLGLPALGFEALEPPLQRAAA